MNKIIINKTTHSEAFAEQVRGYSWPYPPRRHRRSQAEQYLQDIIVYARMGYVLDESWEDDYGDGGDSGMSHCATGKLVRIAMGVDEQGSYSNVRWTLTTELHEPVSVSRVVKCYDHDYSIAKVDADEAAMHLDIVIESWEKMQGESDSDFAME